MEEENKHAESEGGMSETGLLAGKFKSVDALTHAYGELEAEFTRRSQRLKALEEQLASLERPEAAPRGQSEEPVAFPAAFLQAPKVPLMGAGGMGVVAPMQRPASIAEAGSLALNYLKRQK